MSLCHKVQKNRFYATIEHRKVDRPACWLGLPVPESVKSLITYFNVNNIDELKFKLGDDIYPVEVPYNSPPENHIACAFDFVKGKGESNYEERTLTEAGVFKDCSSITDIDNFPWPDPSQHMSINECRKVINKAPANMALLGMMWAAHFQDACAAFGMETALMKMLIEPDIFKAVINRITEFYLKANEFFYKAGKGRLDVVLLGNDLGSQTGLIISPDSVR